MLLDSLLLLSLVEKHSKGSSSYNYDDSKGHLYLGDGDTFLGPEPHFLPLKGH